MKKLTLVCALVFTSALASGCIIVDDDDDGGDPDSSLTIVNESDLVIEEIFVENDLFSDELLGGTGLFPDEEITVLLDCDFYDVTVIDEDGCETAILNFDLCFDDATWFIGNADLDAGCF